jgi:serine/threonine protein phosphatase PrpC
MSFSLIQIISKTTFLFKKNKNQQDAHNSIVDFDLGTNTSFFAVYDGHGGNFLTQLLLDY